MLSSRTKTTAILSPAITSRDSCCLSIFHVKIPKILVICSSFFKLYFKITKSLTIREPNSNFSYLFIRKMNIPNISSDLVINKTIENECTQIFQLVFLNSTNQTQFPHVKTKIRTELLTLYR
jgi:hypothetical protein